VGGIPGIRGVNLRRNRSHFFSRRMVIKSLPRVAGLLLILGLGAVSCRSENNQLPDDVLAVLTEAEQLELLSLDPGMDEKKEEIKEDFNGFPVLGQTQVKDAAVRKQLVEALIEGMRGCGAPSIQPSASCPVTESGQRTRVRSSSW
jgi:hypothetical protein